MKNRYLYPSLAAALIYNIWLLGFILDPGAIDHKYISILEASSSPHHLFFIYCDVLSSLVIIGISMELYLKSRLSKVISLGYFIFGLTNLIAAVIPESCTGTVTQCGIGIKEVIDPHDLLSVIGSLALFISLLYVYKRSPKEIKSLNLSVLLGWCLSGILLVVGVFIPPLTVFFQGLFLIMSGVVIISIPLAVKQRQDRD